MLLLDLRKLPDFSSRNQQLSEGKIKTWSGAAAIPHGRGDVLLANTDGIYLTVKFDVK